MNNSIRTEWENMRCFPIFEYKISESDYLVVELSLSEDNQEIEFSFDSDNKKPGFLAMWSLSMKTVIRSRLILICR